MKICHMYARTQTPGSNVLWCECVLQKQRCHLLVAGCDFSVLISVTIGGGGDGGGDVA